MEQLQPGTRVGEYVVERVLGEGSFGKVYAAIHPVIGKAVAIKVLDLALAARADHVSRFVEEARAVNRIRHRHIVDIFAFGQLPDGRHYFVMELLEGKTLRQFLDEKKRLQLNEALPILRKVGRALDAAHGAGITHRDLKPDNLFLTFDEDGNIFPKLLDFGIAKLTGDAPVGGHRTATGVQMGTPLYMSPEQCRGAGVDHRTDIYAFGVLAFEMLAGRPPFNDEAVVQIIIAHMSKPPPAMSSVAPGISPALDAPIAQMLEKDPARRPVSVSASVDALEMAARQAGMAVPASRDHESAVTPAPKPVVDPKFAATVAAGPAMLTEHSAIQAPPWTPPPQHTQPSPQHIHAQAYAMPGHGSLVGHAGSVTGGGADTNRTLWFVAAGCGALVLLGLLALLGWALLAQDESADAPLAPSASASPGKAVQFDKGQVPRVGTVSDSEESLVMDITMVQGGVTANARHRVVVDRSITVAAVDSERVTRAEVTFRRRDEASSVNGGPEQPQPSTVVGKTFVVSGQGTDIDVERSDGTSVTPAEKKVVAESMVSALQPNVLAGVLGGRALDTGETVEVSPEAAVKLLGGSESSDIEASSAKLVLRSVEEIDGHKVANFDVEINAELTQAGVDFSVALAGTMSVQADTLWPLTVSLRGPIQVDDQRAAAPGSMTIDAKTRYR